MEAVQPGIRSYSFIRGLYSWRVYFEDRCGHRPHPTISNEPPTLQLKGSYSPSYEQRIQDTYRMFREQGIDITEHGINRVLGRVDRGVTIENVVNVYKDGKLFYDPLHGTYIKFKDGIAVSIDTKTRKIVNVQTQKVPSKRWLSR